MRTKMALKTPGIICCHLPPLQRKTGGSGSIAALKEPVSIFLLVVLILILSKYVVALKLNFFVHKKS